MSSEMTLSRPYAKALFDLAKEQKEVETWHERIKVLADLQNDEGVQAVLKSPRIDHCQKADLLIALAKKSKIDSAEVDNLIKLLADNNRLDLFCSIFLAFTDLKANFENSIEAEVVTAVEVSEEYLSNLQKALSKRLDKNVTVTTTIDKSILGGTIIRAGDLVVDGSLKGKLAKLTNTLIH